MIFEEMKQEHVFTAAEMYVKAFNSPPWNGNWTIECAYKRLNHMLNYEGSYGLQCFSLKKNFTTINYIYIIKVSF
jgi:aminoglycoside 6'-N-acetyltransferase I